MVRQTIHSLVHRPLHANRLDFAKQLVAVAERTDSLEAATTCFEAWLRDHT